MGFSGFLGLEFWLVLLMFGGVGNLRGVLLVWFYTWVFWLYELVFGCWVGWVDCWLIGLVWVGEVGVSSSFCTLVLGGTKQPFEEGCFSPFGVGPANALSWVHDCG